MLKRPHFIACFLTTLSEALFFPTQLKADDFYWQFNNNNTWFWGNFPSAQAACTGFKNRPNSNIVSSSALITGEQSGVCVSYWDVGRGEIRGPSSDVRIRRLGDSCTPPAKYTYQTGGCEIDQTDECTLANTSCAAKQEKGLPDLCPSPYAGNPINFSVGNKFQSETDYSVSGSSTLKQTRNYNSLDGLWKHSFSTHLRFSGTQYISLVRHDGRESFYIISGTLITPISAAPGLLSKTDKGWLFVSMNNERFTFGATGRLTHWSNTQGHSYQLAYSGNQITITDNLGNHLILLEDIDRQPLSITAPNTLINYRYNADRRLTSITRTTGGQTTQRHYHYEVPDKPDLLTGITDERGVRYATWAYDDQGRAISSEHADGADKVTVAYNSDGTVSVTNELGKVAKYSFQTIRGVRRITAIEGEPSPNCPNSNSTFTYDERGLLKTKTDNKGILTTYAYNERGLEVSRTEASDTPQARTITTTWHPDWFLPVTITEPDRITQYTYDNQGRQTSQSVTQR